MHAAAGGASGDGKEDESDFLHSHKLRQQHAVVHLTCPNIAAGMSSRDTSQKEHVQLSHHVRESLPLHVLLQDLCATPLADPLLQGMLMQEASCVTVCDVMSS